MSDVLLDTHVLLWYDVTPQKLSRTALTAIQNPNTRVFISSMTAWEIGIKFELGKLPDATQLMRGYHAGLSKYGFFETPFTSADALRAAKLPPAHRDPFDRSLVAQALERNIPIISADPALDRLGVTRIW